jgi:hypothetical protein
MIVKMHSSIRILGASKESCCYILSQWSRFDLVNYSAFSWLRVGMFHSEEMARIV